MPDGFIDEHNRKYRDVSTVESQRNEFIPEEFPEGPYGIPLFSESFGKSSPWREDQRPLSAFTYENRELHEGMPRVFPGDHPTHDENEDETMG